MNCANHADTSAVAYCRTCGKALCANCTRPVKGVIYCEDCLGAKMAGTAPTPSASFAPNAPGDTRLHFHPGRSVGLGAESWPCRNSCGLFSIRRGRRLHAVSMRRDSRIWLSAGLLIAESSPARGGHSTIFIVAVAFATAFFYVYQIIDSVRSARALQMGQTPPDPFNLAQTFGGGERVDTKKSPNWRGNSDSGGRLLPAAHAGTVRVRRQSFLANPAGCSGRLDVCAKLRPSRRNKFRDGSRDATRGV